MKVNGYSINGNDLTYISGRTDIDYFRNARIFITGATGFFGIWLLETFAWLNDNFGTNIHILGLSRDPASFLAGKGAHLRRRSDVEMIAGDLANLPDPGPVSIIIHAASEANLTASPEWAHAHLHGTIAGMQRLLAIAEKYEIKGFLLTTSGAVYGQLGDRFEGGQWKEGPSKIEDLTSERSVYGHGKRLCEIMLAVDGARLGYQAAIARCFAFVGPHLPLSANYAIGNFIRDAIAQRDIVINGDGTPVRSYLYAADLVVWLLAILSRGRTGVPYNVGGAEPVSIAELAQVVAQYAQKPVNVFVKGTPGRGLANVYVPCVERAVAELRLGPDVSLKDSIQKTIEWASNMAQKV
jgi:nucleoside-diphosphate-sugar epimerase